MSHGSTRARFDAATDEVDEPLRSITVHDQALASRDVPFTSILRPFLASWPLLVAGLLLGGAIGYATQSRAPLMYTAEALVVPNRTRTQVQFVPQIKTIDDTSNAQASTALTPERRQALVDLVHSSSVEDQAIADLSGKLAANSLKRGGLVQQVTGGIRPRSEILSIQAVSSSADEAVLIANAWARSYVDEVNRLYAPAASNGSMEALRDGARQDLDAAQSNLNQSIGNSQLETLDQQIQDRQALVALLTSPYQPPAQAGPPSLPQTQTQTTNPSLNDYRLAERRILDDLAQTLRKVQATRDNVRALLSQAQLSGAGGSNNSAAIALLKTQLVSISDVLPSQLQLQLPSDAGSASTAELQTLATSLDAARDELAREFEARRTAYEQHNQQQVTQLQQELQDLRAKREAADAERKRFTNARDLAADTYTALAKKAEEQRVANSTSGHEVEMASEATFASVVPRNGTLMLGGAMLGVLAGTALALLRWFVTLRGSALPGARLSSAQPTKS